ncbi:MAG: GNAT family N-acetyltransferase [Bacteroidetes bacterium]|nr:GNAT family N-acetyltransferase [Bacteroidota bacterium]
MDNTIVVRPAGPDDLHFAETITAEMEESAKARGTGIAKRSPDYIREKINEGKAVIALTAEGAWVGFCYIEAWENENYVANSGLIVSPAFRKSGVAREIKRRIFELSKTKYPNAKIFGLTTGLAVMKINSELGYEPVTYSELTSDEAFWKGCQSCVNYDILMSKGRKNCLCTAMLYDPATAKTSNNPSTNTTSQDDEKRVFEGNFSLFDRWVRFKQFVLLKTIGKKDGQDGGSSILNSFFFL